MIGTLTSTVSNAMNGGYRPPVGFYFRAGLLEQQAAAKGSDSAKMGSVANDVRFQEVSGVSVSLKTEPLIEGGNNEFVHQLPSQTTHENLILKRGLVTNGSDLALWCQLTMLSGISRKIIKKGIYIELMSPDNLVPLMFWSFNGAYPVKWEISPFNSTESAIVVETLEFTYEKMITVPSGMVSGLF